MTTSISPLNQALIEKTKQNNGQNVQKQAPIQTPVPKTGQDTFELSTKSTKAEKAGIIDKIKANKKTILIAAIGLCAAIGGVAICAKKGILPTNISAKADKVTKRGNEILEQGEKIAVQGSEIVEESKRQLDEVLELIKRGKNNDFQDITDNSGNVIRIRRFVDLDGMEKAMEELEGDKVVRRTVFNNFENIGKSNISSIEKGYEKLADGSEKCAETFNFKDGKLSQYLKGGEASKDGSGKFAETFNFEDGKLFQYLKGCKESKDGDIKIAECFEFEDGKASLYQRGYEALKDGDVKIAKEFELEDDKLSEYRKGCKESKDGDIKIAECFKFEDGKACLYQKGYEAPKDGDVKIAKEFELKDDKWKKVDNKNPDDNDLLDEDDWFDEGPDDNE